MNQATSNELPGQEVPPDPEAVWGAMREAKRVVLASVGLTQVVFGGCAALAAVLLLLWPKTFSGQLFWSCYALGASAAVLQLHRWIQRRRSLKGIVVIAKGDTPEQGARKTRAIRVGALFAVCAGVVALMVMGLWEEYWTLVMGSLLEIWAIAIVWHFLVTRSWETLWLGLYVATAGFWILGGREYIGWGLLFMAVGLITSGWQLHRRWTRWVRSRITEVKP